MNIICSSGFYLSKIARFVLQERISSFIASLIYILYKHKDEYYFLKGIIHILFARVSSDLAGHLKRHGRVFHLGLLAECKRMHIIYSLEHFTQRQITVRASALASLKDPALRVKMISGHSACYMFESPIPAFFN